MNSPSPNSLCSFKQWELQLLDRIATFPLWKLTKPTALIIATVIILLSASTSHAVSVTSAADGNWNVSATWVGGKVPVAGDDVIIGSGHDITVTTNTHIKSITFSAGTTRNLTVNSGVILNVTGTAGILIENDAATSSSVTLAGIGIINCSALTVGGTVTNLTADSTTTLISTISNLNVSGGLSVNSEDDGTVENNTTFELQSGTIAVTGTVTLDEESGSVLIFTMNIGAETGTLSVSASTPFTDVGGPAVDFAGTSVTVNYSGGNQTIRATPYRHLTLSGSGTKTPAAALNISGTLTISSGVTMTVAGFGSTLQGGSTLLVNGTLEFGDANGEFISGTSGTSTVTMGSSGLIRTLDANGLGPTTPASDTSFQTGSGGAWNLGSIDTSGTVEYYRSTTSAQIVTDRNYNNLTITGSTQNKTLTQTVSRTINGNLTINASAPFALAGAFSLNVKGNWTNAGIFTHTAGTVTFNGATNQRIGGTSTNTFLTLSVANTGSGDEVVSLTSSALTSVSTALNIDDGIFDQGASSNLTTNTVTVASGATFRNFGTGDLTLTGNLSNAGAVTFSAHGSHCGDADDIQILSNDLTTRTWSGLGTFRITDVTAQRQGGVVTARSSTDAGSNMWVFIADCVLTQANTTYTWEPVLAGAWNLAANWNPDRTSPSSEDILVINGSGTPSPIVTGVPTEEIAALRLTNGASPTLQAGAANNTLIISGKTGTDLSLPASSILTLSGANALRIVIGSGSTASVDGQIILQDAAHRLLGNAESAILFHSGADFTTTTGFSGNAFGSGGGGGNGATGSVQFENGAQYFHGAGDSPFGSSTSPAVTVFQSGSFADWLTATGFQASGRTYATLTVGNSSTEVDLTASGSGDFQFTNLAINSTATQDSSLTFTGSGSSKVTIKGNITSSNPGIGGTLADVSLTAGTGGIQIDGGGIATFGNIGNSRSIFFGSNATIASGTTLGLARVVQMGFSGDGVVTDNGTLNSNSSAGYILGALRRPVISGDYTFHVGTANGYTPVALSAVTGSGDMTIRPEPMDHPALATVAAQSLDEYWNITLNSGSLTTTLQFTYLQTDVDGSEADYKIIRIEDTSASDTVLYFPLTTLVTSANTATVTDIDHFSDWTLGVPAGPSAVSLSRFNAISFSDGVQLTWESGFEVNNLGYHVYREINGKRVRVTPSVVAGSALIVGPDNQMTAGSSYFWFDPQGTPDAVYHLEAIDLNGTRDWSGPISPYAVASDRPSSRRARAKLLTELTKNVTSPGAGQTSSWPTDMAVTGSADLKLTADAVATHQAIASGRAVKIEVRQSGWYRVSQAELVAAGYDPTSDARLLQLFVDGVEVPIGLSTTGPRLNAGDTLEFYGVALDTPTTDTRTYWLVSGNSPGKRMIARRGKIKPDNTDVETSLRSFNNTVELREKIIYTATLLNGDAENIFGAAVFSDGVDQNLTLQHIDKSSGQPELEVALQGLTNQSHEVQVKLNGSALGTMTFGARDHRVQKFAVDRSLLLEGDNLVTLTSMNGESDVNVVDWLRLSYAKFYRATENGLRFTAPGGQAIRIENFSRPNVRVIDVTDPNEPTQQSALAKATGSTYTVTVQVSGNGLRTLLAFTDDLSGHPAALKPNLPSNLNDAANGADMVIITHRDFLSAVEPLATLRRNQGLIASVIDVEDVYDEFSYGAHTPLAVKAFLARANSSWQRKPQYLLLVGDSSWDPRNYLGEGENDFVPTKLIDTRILETASDDWFVDFNGTGLPEVAIGRLPGRTSAEIGLMVSKILKYEQERELNSPLRGAVLVSDNGFETQSSATSGLLPTNVSKTTINRGEIGNDDFMRGQIVDALNHGPMLVNYYGHGSQRVWTGAGLLTNDLVSGLTNVNLPSVYVMMTCLNGYSSDAFIDSLAEASLKAQNGGAVAVWASSGFTEPPPQLALSNEFYRILFGGQPVRLGEATRSAKAATPSLDVRRTWTLYGDPAMRIR